MEKESKENSITLGDIFNSLKKHFILLAIITIAITFLGGIYTFTLAKEKYQSSVTLIVAASDGNSTDVVNSLRFVNTIADLATEDVVLTKVAENYVSSNNEAEVITYANNLRGSVNVKYSTTSFLVTISVTNIDKNLAKEHANLIATTLNDVCNDPNSSIYKLLGNSVQITSNATVGQYVSPNKPMYLIISLVLGVILGCAVVLVIEFSSNKFRKKSDIEEATDKNIIGELFYQKQHVFSLANVINDYKVIEPFNKLFTNIKYLNSVSNVKKIMVTSTVSGELKSTTIAGLALSMVNTGKRVVIVDYDLRMPSEHKIFNVARNNGVVDYIAGDITLEEAIKKTPNGIDVITAGTRIDNINPLIFIESTKLDTLIKELSEKYDYVLFDAPPTLPCNDAIILAKKLDGIIYNVAVERPKKKDFKQCIKNVEDSGTNILGICAMKIKLSKKETTGYYYYGESK